MGRKEVGLAPRKIVEEVLGKATTRELWTINFNPVLPFTLQDFPVGSVMPAMLYMFRWGKRRGTGRFVATFTPTQPLPGNEEYTLEENDDSEPQSPKHPVHVTHLVQRLLASRDVAMSQSDSRIGGAILGDALLCYSVENVRRQEGRDNSVSRVFPTHYFSSWFDLPRSVAHLRMVPELLVHVLSELPGSPGKAHPYSVNTGIANNRLLTLLGTGVVEGKPGDMNLSGDRFDSSIPLALDQLLTSRVALLCGSAPSTLTPSTQAEIPSQQPVCQRAARAFAEDFDALLKGFGTVIPRPSLLPMLESCIGLGMTNLLLSTAAMVETWDRIGRLPVLVDQKPLSIFVDASISLDADLRAAAESSMDEEIKILDRVPVVLSCMRVLQEQVKIDDDRPTNIPHDSNDATAWLNLLGEVLHEVAGDLSQSVLKDTGKLCQRLAAGLEAQEHSPGIVDLLRQKEINPVRRMGQAIILLMGESLQNVRLRKCLDSCLMADQPNGWMRTRETRRKDLHGRSKKKLERSIVLNNTALEFLVHRHLYDPATGQLRPLSLNGFLEILRSRYGFCIDTAPPGGLRIAGELLDRNRRILENRLRDLGLLVSVNDAKSMKRLQSRYALQEVSP